MFFQIISGLFGIAFERHKSIFNTQKNMFEEKKYLFSKKIKSASNGLKNLKITKTHFGKSLKMKLLSKSFF
jgi:hypothetical protein